VENSSLSPVNSDWLTFGQNKGAYGLELGPELGYMTEGMGAFKLSLSLESMRQQLHRELGFSYPAFDVTINPSLPDYRYVVRIGDQRISGELEGPDKIFAVGPKNRVRNLSASVSSFPGYDLPGGWTEKTRSIECEKLGLVVLSPRAVLTQHLTLLTRRWGHLIICELDFTRNASWPLIQEVDKLGLVDRVVQTVRALYQQGFTQPFLRFVLESIVSGVLANVPDCVSKIRRRYTDILCAPHVRQGVIQAFVFSEENERELCQDLNNIPSSLADELTRALREVADQGTPILLVQSDRLRLSLHNWMRDKIPGPVILSHNDIVPNVGINVLDEIDPYETRNAEGIPSRTAFKASLFQPLLQIMWDRTKQANYFDTYSPPESRQIIRELFGRLEKVCPVRLPVASCVGYAPASPEDDELALPGCYHVRNINLSIGYDLLDLVDTRNGKTSPFLDHIKICREQIRERSGFELPGVWCRDDGTIPRNSYVLSNPGHAAGPFALYIDHSFVAGITGDKPGYNPVTGEEGAWLPKDSAEAREGTPAIQFLTSHVVYAYQRAPERTIDIATTELLLKQVATSDQLDKLKERYSLRKLSSFLRAILKYGCAFNLELVVESLLEPGDKSLGELAISVIAQAGVGQPRSYG
jgi:flagellar biosynthesis component FlhA